MDTNTNYDEIKQTWESDRFEPQKDSYNSIRFRLDPTPQLDMIYAEIMRMQWDVTQQKYIKTDGLKPMFDGEGVDDLLGILRCRLSQHTALSQLEENKIRQFCREIGRDVLKFMVFHMDRYHIKKEDFSRIQNLIVHNAEIFLRRAKGGNTLLNELKQYRYIESANQTQRYPKEDEQKKGLLSGFGGFKR